MLQGDLPLFSRYGGLAYQRLFCSCLTRVLADAEQGRSAADHAAGRLVLDLVIRQCLFQFGYASIGDLGVQEVEHQKFGQRSQVY